MNNYENPYIRLQTYYSWISRGSYDLDGMSILELHHYTQIPIGHRCYAEMAGSHRLKI